MKCPIALGIRIGKIPKEHDCPKIRNAIQRCPYPKTGSDKEAETDSGPDWQKRAETAEAALSEAREEIKRLKAKPKKKKSKRTAQ